MNTYKAEEVILESYERHGGKTVNILLAMYKGNYHRFLLSAFFYLIKHSPTWVMPIVIANIVNIVMYPEKVSDPIRDIGLNAVVMMVLVILNVPMNYLHVHFSSKAVRTVEAGLRGALIRKLQQLSISYHNDVQAGRIQSKVIRDVEAVQVLSSQLFVSLLNIVINITVALGITIVSNRTVFFFFLLTIPVASLTIVFFRTKIKRQNHRFRKEIEATSARVLDMEEMIPITRAHALETVELNKTQNFIKHVAEEGYRLDVIQANFGSVSWAIFQLFQVGCLVFTGWLVLKQAMLGGDIVMYQSYFTTIVTQVSALIMLLPTIAKGLESIRSIGEILTENDIEQNDGKLIIEGLEGRYKFKNVRFQYKESKEDVLRGMDMDVKPGETIAFVGESGAGKSTTINMLIGFILPTSGELMVDGNDIADINLKSYRRYIAVVPQNTILFSGSIRENISYGLEDISDKQVWDAIDAAHLRELIEQLPKGLETLIGEHGNKLSGGQRQRIAIARAIIRNPKVIIFDEATSALDSVSEKLILDALNNLIKGRTTFIVAHRLSTIKQADRICVLRDGKAVEFGSYSQLMDQKGEFYKMKQLQS